METLLSFCWAFLFYNIMRTGYYYWQTEYYHCDNTFTLNDWLDNHCQDDILILLDEGSYCELELGNGEIYSISAQGDGDSYSHVVHVNKITEKEGQDGNR